MKTYMTCALALLVGCQAAEPDTKTVIIYQTGDDDDDDQPVTPKTFNPWGDDDDSTGTEDTGTMDTEDTEDTDTVDTGTILTDTGDTFVDTGTVVTTDTGTVSTSLGFPSSSLPDYYFTRSTTFDIDEPLPNSNDVEGELYYRVSDGVVIPSPGQVNDPYPIEAALVAGPVDAADCRGQALGPNFAFSTTGAVQDLEEGAWLCVQSREGKIVAIAVVMDWTDTLVLRVYE